MVDSIASSKFWLTAQLNQIIKEEGLAASLIRPRWEPLQTSTGARPSVSSDKASTAATDLNEISSVEEPITAAGGETDGMQVDVMEELAGQLDSTLALAFVPTSVRRKGGGGKPGGDKKGDVKPE